MQQWHIKNKQINDIICKWCYIIWFSPEMDFMPMVEFLLQVIINVFQLFMMAFILSVKWRMKCNIMRFQESVAFDWSGKIVFIDQNVKMDIQERTFVSFSSVYCQHVKLYGFITIWESRRRFQQGISQTDHAKNWGGYHNARGHHKCGKFIIKIGTTKCDLILIKRICG